MPDEKFSFKILRKEFGVRIVVRHYLNGAVESDSIAIPWELISPLIRELETMKKSHDLHDHKAPETLSKGSENG